MLIVETSVFTRLIADLLSDEDFRHLQWALVLRPEQGALVRGTGGLRKLRWKRPGGGKRGGLRVLYYWAPEVERIYLVYAFAKSDKSDLTQDQIKQLGRLVREELK